MIRLTTISAIAAVVLFRSVPACAAPYALPLILNDSNISVSFEVDSTWHLVKGSTAGISGKIWQENPSDLNTIVATISIPVEQFNTDNSSRDERMREVLHADKYPLVQYSLQQVQTDCPPSTDSNTLPCAIKLRGTVEISGTQKPIEISGTMQRDQDGFLVQGETNLSWKDFGVEDPSIFIARLDEDVHVSFQVHVPASDS